MGVSVKPDTTDLAALIAERRKALAASQGSRDLASLIAERRQAQQGASPDEQFAALIAQGAGLGFAGKIYGGLDAADKYLHGDKNFAANYEATRDRILGAEQQAITEHPIAGRATEALAGAIPFVLSGGTSAPVKGGTLARIGKGAVQGAKVGAAYGAASGVGHATGDVADYLTQGTEGAVGGAMFGGLIGGAAPAAGAVLSTALDRLGARPGELPPEGPTGAPRKPYKPLPSSDPALADPRNREILERPEFIRQTPRSTRGGVEQTGPFIRPTRSDAAPVEPVDPLAQQREVLRAAALQRIEQARNAPPEPVSQATPEAPADPITSAPRPENAPAPHAAGASLYDSARNDAGNLRPLHRVSDDGLVREYGDQVAKMQEYERRGLYNYTQDENLHSTEDGRTVVSATRKGGRVTDQAKAATNQRNAIGVLNKIEAELQRRGLSANPDELLGRYEQMLEREGATADAGDVSFTPFGKINLTGEPNAGPRFKNRPGIGGVVKTGPFIQGEQPQGTLDVRPTRGGVQQTGPFAGGPRSGMVDAGGAEGTKVVGADGKPLDVYHGTTKNFDGEFRVGSAPGWGEGVYFTDNAKQAGEEFGFGGRVIRARVNLQNPYRGETIPERVLENTAAWKKVASKWQSPADAWQEDSRFVGDALRELGYDGVMVPNSNNIDGLEVVAFRPDQIQRLDTPPSGSSRMGMIDFSGNPKLTREQRGLLQRLGIGEAVEKERFEPTPMIENKPVIKNPTGGYMDRTGAIDFGDPSPTVSALGNALKPASMGERARSSLVRVLEDAGLTPEAALAKARELAAKGEKPETIMDLAGKPGARLGRTVRAASPKAGQVIDDALETRALGSPQRAINDALETSGLKQRSSGFQTTQQLIEQRAKDAHTGYGETFKDETPINDERVTEILNTPAGKRAWKRAVTMMRNDGVKIATGKQNAEVEIPGAKGLQSAKIKVPMDVETPTIQQLHYLKLALDDMARPGMDRGAGQGGLGFNEARSISGVKGKLLAIMDEHSPAYAQARQQYAETSALKDASELGRRLWKMHPEEAAHEFAQLGSEAERDVARRSGMDALADRLENGPEDVAKGAKKPRDLARIRLLFPDEASFNAFRDRIAREAQMAQTYTTASKGSQTADKLNDLAGMLDLPMTLSPRRLITAALHARGRLASRALAEETAPLLTKTGPDLTALLEQVSETYKRNVAKNARTSRITSAAAAGLGSESGRR